MQNITEIDELIKLISRLPGLGPKSAKRIVLKLINNREELIKPMAKTLAEMEAFHAKGEVDKEVMLQFRHEQSPQDQQLYIKNKFKCVLGFICFQFVSFLNFF